MGEQDLLGDSGCSCSGLHAWLVVGERASRLVDWRHPKVSKLGVKCEPIGMLPYCCCCCCKGLDCCPADCAEPISLRLCRRAY